MKPVFLLLLISFIFHPAYAQNQMDNRNLKSVSGKVVQVDAVGNMMTVQADSSTSGTANPQQMAFYVPDKTSITKGTRDIGLMDISQGNPVTVQYYLSSLGKYTAASIIDNSPLSS